MPPNKSSLCPQNLGHSNELSGHSAPSKSLKPVPSSLVHLWSQCILTGTAPEPSRTTRTPHAELHCCTALTSSFTLLIISSFLIFFGTPTLTSDSARHCLCL